MTQHDLNTWSMEFSTIVSDRKHFGLFCGTVSLESLAHGKWKRGPTHHNTKINADIVTSIRLDHERGASNGMLSKRYGLSPSHIFKIVHKRTWKYV